MAECEKVINELEETLSHAPLASAYACMIPKLVVEEALNLIKSLKDGTDALITGQETLQKYIAEKNAEIEKLKKKLTLAECCICDIEDALDRGSDNDWAREHIEDYEKEVATID